MLWCTSVNKISFRKTINFGKSFLCTCKRHFADGCDASCEKVILHAEHNILVTFIFKYSHNISVNFRNIFFLFYIINIEVLLFIERIDIGCIRRRKRGSNINSGRSKI